MIVINNYQNVYPEDGIRYFNWEKFSDSAVNCILFNGGPQHAKMQVDPSVPKYLMFLEEQLWDRDTTDLWVPYVDKIFTILSPKISGRHAKRQSIPFPIDQSLITNLSFQKNFDVMYAGVAGGTHVNLIINSISKFNYRWVSYGSDPRVTNRSITFPEKLELMSQCRATVCHGLTGTNTPQTKGKYFFAAFTKSLNIMLRDPWNCIEEWFNPNEDFIYFNSQSELEYLIRDVSNNYEKYLPIVENAYNKAIREYTTSKFVEKYIGLKPQV